MKKINSCPGNWTFAVMELLGNRVYHIAMQNTFRALYVARRRCAVVAFDEEENQKEQSTMQQHIVLLVKLLHASNSRTPKIIF